MPAMSPYHDTSSKNCSVDLDLFNCHREASLRVQSSPIQHNLRVPSPNHYGKQESNYFSNPSMLCKRGTKIWNIFKKNPRELSTPQRYREGKNSKADDSVHHRNGYFQTPTHRQPSDSVHYRIQYFLTRYGKVNGVFCAPICNCRSCWTPVNEYPIYSVTIDLSCSEQQFESYLAINDIGDFFYARFQESQFPKSGVVPRIRAVCTSLFSVERDFIHKTSQPISHDTDILNIIKLNPQFNQFRGLSTHESTHQLHIGRKHYILFIGTNKTEI